MIKIRSGKFFLQTVRRRKRIVEVESRDDAKGVGVAKERAMIGVVERLGSTRQETGKENKHGG